MTVPCTQEQRSEIWMALRAAATAAGEAMASLDHDTSIDMNKVNPAIVQAQNALKVAQEKIKDLHMEVVKRPHPLTHLNNRQGEQMRKLSQQLGDLYRQATRTHPSAMAFRLQQMTLHQMKSKAGGVKSLTVDKRRLLNVLLKEQFGLRLEYCFHLRTPFYYVAPLTEDRRPREYKDAELELLVRI